MSGAWGSWTMGLLEMASWTFRLSPWFLVVALCFVMNEVKWILQLKKYGFQQAGRSERGTALRGRKRSFGWVAFCGMSVCTFAKTCVHPAFPDWIPTTQTVGAQDPPSQVFSLLSNSRLISQCQTTIYKAIFFVLDNSRSRKLLEMK